MRIAILTFHKAVNCGAALQAWALRVALERMGHQVEFFDCTGEQKRWLTRLPCRGVSLCTILKLLLVDIMSVPIRDLVFHRYRKFQMRYLPDRTCPSDEIKSRYDLLVVGSDQVWNFDLIGKGAEFFLAEALPAEVRKITYAISLGDVKLPEDRKGRLREAMMRFSALSVREPSAREQLRQLTTQEIAVVLDPTLLLEACDYGKIEGGKVSGDYLFLYTVYAKPFFIQTAKQLAKRLGVKCVIATCYCYSWHYAFKGVQLGVSPDRLVRYVRNAKYVLAASFHGTVLGAIFEKPMLSLRESVDTLESRPAAFLRQMGCAERLVNPIISLDEMQNRLLAPSPMYAERVRPLREESLAWLAGNLK